MCVPAFVCACAFVCVHAIVSVCVWVRENGHGTYADDYWTVTFIGPDRTPKKRLLSFSVLSQRMKKIVKRNVFFFLISNSDIVESKLCPSLYFGLTKKSLFAFASHKVDGFWAKNICRKWMISYFCIFTAPKNRTGRYLVIWGGVKSLKEKNIIPTLTECCGTNKLTTLCRDAWDSCDF